MLSGELCEAAVDGASEGVPALSEIETARKGGSVVVSWRWEEGTPCGLFRLSHQRRYDCVRGPDASRRGARMQSPN